MSLYFSEVEYTPAKPRESDGGLVGYVKVVVNNTLVLDGLTIRRERSGDLSLSYPVRRDGRGRSHRLMRPVHDHARRLFQRQLFEELRRRGIYL